MIHDAKTHEALCDFNDVIARVQAANEKEQVAVEAARAAASAASRELTNLQSDIVSGKKRIDALDGEVARVEKANECKRHQFAALAAGAETLQAPRKSTESETAITKTEADQRRKAFVAAALRAQRALHHALDEFDPARLAAAIDAKRHALEQAKQRRARADASFAALKQRTILSVADEASPDEPAKKTAKPESPDCATVLEIRLDELRTERAKERVKAEEAIAAATGERDALKAKLRAQAAQTDGVDRAQHEEQQRLADAIDALGCARCRLCDQPIASAVGECGHE